VKLGQVGRSKVAAGGTEWWCRLSRCGGNNYSLLALLADTGGGTNCFFACLADGDNGRVY
jgi:hypothetical protein